MRLRLYRRFRILTGPLGATEARALLRDRVSIDSVSRPIHFARGVPAVAATVLSHVGSVSQATSRARRALVCLLPLAVFFFSSELHTEGPARKQFAFERLTVDNGLSQNEVVCIYEDRDGFLWLGTNDGLNRFDGFQFVAHRAEPWADSGLAHSMVTSIFELRDEFVPSIDSRFHGLWVGTDGGGLAVSDRHGRSRLKYDYHPENPRLISSATISTILQDRRGTIWVATNDGLNVFHPQTESFVRVDYDHVPCLIPDQILSLCEDKGGAIWIGTLHGLYRHFPERNVSTRYARDGTPGERISSDSVEVVYHDSRGNVWIGTRAGLDRFDPSTELVQPVPLIREHPAGPRSNRVVSICEDRQGFLWVGMLGGGLGRLDPKSTTWTWSYQDPNDPSSISDDAVLSIQEDFSGTLWFGTRRGVNKLIPDRVQFDHFRSKGSTRESIVWSICDIVMDGAPVVFVGTQAGLATIDESTYRLNTFSPPQVEGIEVLNRHPVRAIIPEGEHVLWVGTLGGGLFRYDLTRDVITHHWDHRFLPHVYSLALDGEGTVWVGTNDNALLRYTIATGRFSPVPPPSAMDEKNKEWVITINKPRSGGPGSPHSLWLGTWVRGLICLDTRTLTRSYFRHESSNPKSLSNNTVFAIHESEHEPGILWIGTDGGGLCRFNPEDTTFTTYTRRQGLPDNVIYGILEDHLGVLWLSTNSGLARFDPRSGDCRNYEYRDGLQSNEFNLGASFESGRGDLYFGGPNGLNRFFPDRIINPHPPRVHLTNLSYPGIGDRPVSSDSPIQLSHGEGFLSFEFLALHFKDPLKNRYAYMLEGSDSEWRFVNSEPEARYLGLQPGRYRFVVKAANCDGVWSEPKAMATVIIAPPFWSTWWFFTLCGLLLGGSVFLYHQSKIRRIIQFERAGAEERERLRKNLAADFHDEIGHKTTAISLGAELLTEELRDASPHVQAQLSKIVTQSEQISREIRDLTWELDPDKDSLLDLAEYLKGISDQLFDATDIAFRLIGIDPTFETIKLSLEWRRNLTRIFKEAMHNVAKHAADCRNVTLSFELHNRDLKIALSDDGRGFDTTCNDERRGDGLRNMHRRAGLLSSNVVVVSHPSSGTDVRFEGKLPV